MMFGGLVFHALKVVFGNIDVAFIVLSFAIFYSLVFTILAVYERSKGAKD